MNPVEILSKRVADRTLLAVATDLGISVTYLHEVLKGTRKPGPKVLKALGMTREVVYRKAK